MFQKSILNKKLLLHLAEIAVVVFTGEEYIPYVVMAKEKNTGNSIYLSREELDFIIKYRALSEENKQILAGFLSNKP